MDTAHPSGEALGTCVISAAESAFSKPIARGGAQPLSATPTLPLDSLSSLPWSGGPGPRQGPSCPSAAPPGLEHRSLQDGTTAAHAVMTADTVAGSMDGDVDRLEPPAQGVDLTGGNVLFESSLIVMESRG